MSDIHGIGYANKPHAKPPQHWHLHDYSTQLNNNKTPSLSASQGLIIFLSPKILLSNNVYLSK